MSSERFDAVVVGAGPAGLAAAGVLGHRGHAVLLVDEAPVPGGRLRAQWYRLGASVWDGAAEVERLVGALAPPVQWRLSTAVTALSGSWADGFSVDLARGRVAARAVLLATGATEVPVPIPGWTLPGVLAVGAAQTLWKGWGIPPGRRGVIVGTNPLGFAVAQELHGSPVESLAIVMPPGGMGAAHLGSLPMQWDHLFDLAAGAPRWAQPVARWLHGRAGWQRAAMRLYPAGGIAVAGARLHLRRQALALEGGRDGVKAVRLQRVDAKGHPVGAPWSEAVDFVLLAGGLRPLEELAAQAGVARRHYAGLGGEVPLVTAHLATSRPGVFAAGNALGVESARVAMAQGQLAGWGMVAQLGGDVPPSQWQEAQRALDQARRDVPFAFQPGLAAARQRHQEDSEREVGP